MTYRIMVGVDGSPHSEAALRWSLVEAERRRGRVAAVFAWQVPFMSFPGAFDRDELKQVAKQFRAARRTSQASNGQLRLDHR